MSELSELHRDALGELFNLGVGRAAHSLSQMVRDEIELSAPFVDLIHAHEVTATLIGSEFKELSMVTIDFEGPFVSKAMNVNDEGMMASAPTPEAVMSAITECPIESATMTLLGPTLFTVYTEVLEAGGFLMMLPRDVLATAQV